MTFSKCTDLEIQRPIEKRDRKGKRDKRYNTEIRKRRQKTKERDRPDRSERGYRIENMGGEQKSQKQ